jgi:hypothetical protein
MPGYWQGGWGVGASYTFIIIHYKNPWKIKYKTNNSKCYRPIGTDTTVTKTNSLLFRTVFEWNQLEEEHVNATSVTVFKTSSTKTKNYMRSLRRWRLHPISDPVGVIHTDTDTK